MQTAPVDNSKDYLAKVELHPSAELKGYFCESRYCGSRRQKNENLVYCSCCKLLYCKSCIAAIDTSDPYTGYTGECENVKLDVCREKLDIMMTWALDRQEVRGCFSPKCPEY